MDNDKPIDMGAPNSFWGRKSGHYSERYKMNILPGSRAGSTRQEHQGPHGRAARWYLARAKSRNKMNASVKTAKK